MVSGAETPFVSDHRLTPQELHALAARSGRKPIRARKIGYVAARASTAREVVETRWNGRETSNTAEVGDWIATNLTPDRQPLRDRDGNLNTYVIKAARFPQLYEPAGSSDGETGAIYKAKAVVTALSMPGGFDIVAPWGERQTGASGYLILNGDEVYGIAGDAFGVTYEVLAD